MTTGKFCEFFNSKIGWYVNIQHIQSFIRNINYWCLCTIPHAYLLCGSLTPGWELDRHMCSWTLSFQRKNGKRAHLCTVSCSTESKLQSYFSVTLPCCWIRPGLQFRQVLWKVSTTVNHPAVSPRFCYTDNNDREETNKRKSSRSIETSYLPIYPQLPPSRLQSCF